MSVGTIIVLQSWLVSGGDVHPALIFRPWLLAVVSKNINFSIGQLVFEVVNMDKSKINSDVVLEPAKVFGKF